MLERQTLEQFLLDQSLPVPERVECPTCHNSHPAFAFGITDDAGSYKCGQCLIDDDRLDVMVAEAALNPLTAGWDTELGNEVRQQRNAFLDQWRWTIFPDSPLTPLCQEQFQELFVVVNRISVDYSTPYAAREYLNNILLPELEYANPV